MEVGGADGGLGGLGLAQQAHQASTLAHEGASTLAHEMRHSVTHLAREASSLANHRETVAQAIVPFKVLRPGFRVVPLADRRSRREGDLAVASLLCFFSWDFECRGGLAS